ncbi:unnamed protein product [Closterium sp. Naga37s-1]|nr:unnamed protein product [Closterium sp. Naga37s-1]
MYSTLTSRFLPARCIPASILFSFFNNWFAGSIPYFIASLPQLTTLGLFCNYLTGTMPIPSTSLVSLDVGLNFLSGSFPQLSLAVCAADQNCFLNSSYCRTYGVQQRPASACVFCGTTDGQGVLCGGGTCAPLSQGVVNVPSLPLVPMACPGPVQGSRTTRSPLSANLNSLALKGSLPADITKLTTFTYLSLRSNLLSGRLDAFLSGFKGCTNLQHILLSYNYFYGEVPSFVKDLRLLITLDVRKNYLTGTIPPLPMATLKSINFENNFISDLPSLSSSFECYGTQNCLSNPFMCRLGGTVQRPAAQCAICGTTNAVALCWGAGGECVPASASNIAAGVVNSRLQALVPLSCSALLALKASLGVTFTSWAATVPCQVVGKQPPLPTWSGVLCDETEGVLYISLAHQSLQGSIHSSISKLTALTYLFLHYNWFAGSIPSFIASLPNLTTLGLFSNYLTGTMPITSTSLVALDVGLNYLSGSFPNLSLKSCSADHNCFLSSSYCRSSGLLQRPASACAICGSADGQGELCFGPFSG